MSGINYRPAADGGTVYGDPPARIKKGLSIRSPARRNDADLLGGGSMKRKSIAPVSPEPAVATRSRRKFLQAATGVAAGTTLGFPMIARGQAGPITMRWQSTWPSKDIFHEYALDYAKIVNDMTGGDLKIEVLPAGAVVPAFGLLEAEIGRASCRERG